MAARTAFGSREGMEDTFTTDELRALFETCRACGVDRYQWHLCEAISRPWEMLAHERLTDKNIDKGMTPRTASSLAALRLGLNTKTLESRRRTWRKRAESVA